MTQKRSPLAMPDTWDEVAAPYTSELVPSLFEAASREALARVGVSAGARVVDVACGPGTLSLLAARAGAEVSALDFSPAMIGQLKARVAQAGLSTIEARLGDGMELPYEDASFDAGFSLFGLIFFPDRGRGFQELRRVLRPGGGAAVSSWAPMDTVPQFAAFFRELFTLLDLPAPSPAPLPLAEPEALRAEMEAGGFSAVEVRQVPLWVDTDSTRALVETTARSNAMLVPLRRGLGAARWGEVTEQLCARMESLFGPGPQRYQTVANLATGRR